MLLSCRADFKMCYMTRPAIPDAMWQLLRGVPARRGVQQAHAAAATLCIVLVLIHCPGCIAALSCLSEL